MVSLRRRRFLACVSGVSAAALAGCAGSDDAPDVDAVVRMTGELVFDPDRVVVSVGDVVGWQTVGQPAHTVTAYEDLIPTGAAYFASGGFDSESAAREGYPEGAVEATEWYTHRFTVPGTYEYFCVPHERGMTGTVVVEE